MDSANSNGNIGIRVVSPDRPTKSSVAIGGSENDPSSARCGPQNGPSDGVQENCSEQHYRHQQEQQQPVVHATMTRRNSSIGLSLPLGEESNDTIPSYQQVQQSGYPSFTAPTYNKPGRAWMEQRRDYSYAASRDDEVDGGGIQPYRPLVGSGAAAAYEALRHDFYVQKNNDNKTQRRMSSLSFGSAKGRSTPSGELDEVLLPKDVVRRAQGDEQFEMLKLHYFNLVNEIQETAMMLNICEQHQLMLQQQAAGVVQQYHNPGGPEPSSSSRGANKRPVPTDGSFEISVPTKIVKI